MGRRERGREGGKKEGRCWAGREDLGSRGRVGTGHRPPRSA
jgi:hypothetical protein